ncbi:MAG: hypothetical protein L0206_24200, partial [Actinobacteria bacterium]|nr:hypothetical protein [Actinomycetota bacterium]
MTSEIASAVLDRHYAIALARYLPDGTLDDSFGTGGIVITPVGRDVGVGQIALQLNGKIVVSGASLDDTGLDRRIMTARYLPDGAPDESFGIGGVALLTIGSEFLARRDDVGGALAIQIDGPIIVGGSTLTSGSASDLALVRYLGDPTGLPPATTVTTTSTTTTSVTTTTVDVEPAPTCKMESPARSRRLSRLLRSIDRRLAAVERRAARLAEQTELSPACRAEV